MRLIWADMSHAGDAMQVCSVGGYSGPQIAHIVHLSKHTTGDTKRGNHHQPVSPIIRRPGFCGLAGLFGAHEGRNKA